MYKDSRQVSYKPNIQYALMVGGFVIIILIWQLLFSLKLFPQSILPAPFSVLMSFKELVENDSLFKNIGSSISLNLMGYLEALLIAVPIGFVIALTPLLRILFNKPIDTLRFLPLTAVTGLFIAWFGIGNPMKVHFLAFGIIVYLLPVIIQRIDEVDQVYLQTVYTLGASKWQTLKTIYFPQVLSRLSDDTRVLVAISWTYIIIAEMLNSTGGIGSLIFKVGQRQGRIDKVFALLIIIIIIGFLQDRLFVLLDKIIFPFKHKKSK